MIMVKPKYIRLDASTVCQLKCPSCPTAKGVTAKALGSHFLLFTNFKQLVGKNPFISKIELSNWGEISSLPILRWQFVAFGHNEHEIPIAKKMAHDLNMIFGVKLDAGDMLSTNNKNPSFSPIKNKKAISKETGLGVASRNDYYKKFKELYRQRSICSQLWTQPQINADGRGWDRVFTFYISFSQCR